MPRLAVAILPFLRECAAAWPIAALVALLTLLTCAGCARFAYDATYPDGSRVHGEGVSVLKDVKVGSLRHTSAGPTTRSFEVGGYEGQTELQQATELIRAAKAGVRP